MPDTFVLYQNYPNPFNPTTTLRFSISRQSFVNLKIFNMVGQEVKEIINDELSPGIHSALWDGKNKAGQSVGSGLYFSQLKTIEGIKYIKILLIR